MAKTLAEKVWAAHVVRQAAGEPDLLYIDLHLVHEVTSPQAFDGLRASGRKVRRPDLTLATEDHNVPTIDILKPIADPISRAQVDALRNNCAEFGVPLYSLGNVEQGGEGCEQTVGIDDAELQRLVIGIERWRLQKGGFDPVAQSSER